MKTAILLGEIGSLLLFLFSAPFSFIVCDAVSVPAAIPVPFTVCCRRCFSWCGKTARFAFTYWLLLPFTGALFLPLLSQLVFFLFGCRSTFFFVFGWQPTPKAFIGGKSRRKEGKSVCREFPYNLLYTSELFGRWINMRTDHKAIRSAKQLNKWLSFCWKNLGSLYRIAAIMGCQNNLVVRKMGYMTRNRIEIL